MIDGWTDGELVGHIFTQLHTVYRDGGRTAAALLRLLSKYRSKCQVSKQASEQAKKTIIPSALPTPSINNYLAPLFAGSLACGLRHSLSHNRSLSLCFSLCLPLSPSLIRPSFPLFFPDSKPRVRLGARGALLRSTPCLSQYFRRLMERTLVRRAADETSRTPSPSQLVSQ